MHLIIYITVSKYVSKQCNNRSDVYLKKCAGTQILGLAEIILENNQNRLTINQSQAPPTPTFEGSTIKQGLQRLVGTYEPILVQVSVNLFISRNSIIHSELMNFCQNSINLSVSKWVSHKSNWQLVRKKNYFLDIIHLRCSLRHSSVQI